MEASEPKWVNPILNIIEVNSLRFGGLHIFLVLNFEISMLCFLSGKLYAVYAGYNTYSEAYTEIYWTFGSRLFRIYINLS